jgi:2'-5' RNA ligase
MSEGADSVLELGARVYAGLRNRGLRFDDRPLAPHLTLARVPDDATLAEAKTVATALGSIEVGRLHLPVAEIAVVQSVLSPKGPRYTALATVPLAHN